MHENFYTCKTENQIAGGNNIKSIGKNPKFANGGVLTFKSLYKEER